MRRQGPRSAVWSGGTLLTVVNGTHEVLACRRTGGAGCGYPVGVGECVSEWVGGVGVKMEHPTAERS